MRSERAERGRACAACALTFAPRINPGAEVSDGSGEHREWRLDPAPVLNPPVTVTHVVGIWPKDTSLTPRASALLDFAEETFAAA